MYRSVHIFTISLDAISHCGDSIESKIVTAVDELKVPNCGNATEETEKDAEVEKSDYIDEDKTTCTN